MRYVTHAHMRTTLNPYISHYMLLWKNIYDCDIFHIGLREQAFSLMLMKCILLKGTVAVTADTTAC